MWNKFRHSLLLPLGNYVKKKMSVRRVIYIFCFFMFCVIDQRIKTCSGRDGLMETFQNLTGIVMAVLIVTFWDKQEFRRYLKTTIAWGFIWGGFGVAAYLWGVDHRPFMNEWIVVILNVGIYGWILIHFIGSFWREKTWRLLVQAPKKQRLAFLALFLMFLLMIVSRSTYLWPFCYLVMFGCYYYWAHHAQNHGQDHRLELIKGMSEGILIAFYAFWAYCVVYRPYDKIRYIGIYDNPNINALFYLICLACALTKWYEAIRNHLHLLYRIFLYITIGCIVAMLFMTIGRIGWFSAFIMILSALYLISRDETVRKKTTKVRKMLFRRLAVFVLTFLITVPACYCTIRYIPPLFHHPVWFWGEGWSEEERVLSKDPWDSEKYVDPLELLDAALGRVTRSITDLFELSSSLTPKVYAASDAVLTNKNDINNAYTIRGNIYWFFLQNLNLRGHEAEFGFQLTPYYWVNHAHNIFLQMGTDFGIPVAILFLGLMLMTLSRSARDLRLGNTPPSQAGICFWLTLAILIFGMLEYSWRAYSLNMMILFLNWSYLFIPASKTSPSDTTLVQNDPLVTGGSLHV
jgi:hypothetical protein